MIHQTIIDNIKEALRAKDTLRLEVLRGLNALFQNELLSGTTTTSTLLPDDKALVLIKRSAKQRKDSIEQFEKGKRPDLVAKEKAELEILTAFLPKLMTREEITVIARQRITTLMSGDTGASGGKITGMLIKELGGKADGADVKAVVEELMKG